jgi:ribose-phosphate pyrophosphokinase
MGQAKSAARFARTLGLPVAAGNKERISDTEVIIGGLVGNQVKGHKRALIYDDEIATGGSILELSRVLINEGNEIALIIKRDFRSQLIVVYQNQAKFKGILDSNSNFTKAYDDTITGGFSVYTIK